MQTFLGLYPVIKIFAVFSQMVNMKLYLFHIKSLWRTSKFQFKSSIVLLCISCPSISQKCLHVSMCIHKKKCGWPQNLCVYVYMSNEYVINRYIFIILNSVCNTTLLPVSNMIIKKRHRNNWSFNFVIANIQPLSSPQLTWDTNLELVVLTPFIAHGETYILVLITSFTSS